MVYTYILIVLLNTSVGIETVRSMATFDYRGDNLARCEKLQNEAEKALRSEKSMEIIYSKCVPGEGWEFSE